VKSALYPQQYSPIPRTWARAPVTKVSRKSELSLRGAQRRGNLPGRSAVSPQEIATPPAGARNGSAMFTQTRV